MSQVLYRKYRPLRFADLVGQNSIRVTLQNELENNRIAHAYLFSGPRGIGKTTTARLLAKSVNCQKIKKAEPCEKCDFCREINEGRSLDVIEIDAASHTGVDNVRENIIENSRFTPQRLKYKVFIIDEVHMLSISAFNALLKTLEEPPEHIIFILATTEIHRVPETIISRCQRFDFKRVSVEELVRRLQYITNSEKVNVDESLLKQIARRAEGSVRDAEVMLGQVLALGEKNITEEKASLVIPRSNTNLIVEFFKYLLQKDSSSAIALVNRLVEEGVTIPNFTKDLIDFMRRALLLRVSGSPNELKGLLLEDDVVKEIKNLTASLSVDYIVSMIEIIMIKSRDLKYAQIIQLPLELAVLEICSSETKKTTVPAPPSTSGDVNQPIDKLSTKPGKDEKLAKKTMIHSAIFEKVKESWPEIISKLKDHNHSISLSLKVGIPLAVNNDLLTIGFRYKFHAERIKDPKVIRPIEKVFKKVIGKSLRLKAEVLSEEEFSKLITSEAKSSDTDKIWDQAIQVFGGEIVDDL